MTQKLTILFDLDGTLVDTAPDLMGAHNHVMKKFGYPQKSLEDIKHIAGRGAWIMMQRTFRDEIKDEKLKKEMVKEFIDYYAKNINNEFFELIFNIDSGEKFFFNNISIEINDNSDKYTKIYEHAMAETMKLEEKTKERDQKIKLKY